MKSVPKKKKKTKRKKDTLTLDLGLLWTGQQSILLRCVWCVTAKESGEEFKFHFQRDFHGSNATPSTLPFPSPHPTPPVTPAHSAISPRARQVFSRNPLKHWTHTPQHCCHGGHLNIKFPSFKNGYRPYEQHISLRPQTRLKQSCCETSRFNHLLQKVTLTHTKRKSLDVLRSLFTKFLL